MVNTKEIARLCGVSRGTVDRALNNRPGISPETKRKILQVAEEVGYRPNFIAKSLVTKKTMTIAIVVFDINNRIFSQIANAIETRARELGYFVYLTLTHKKPELEKEYIRYLVDRKVDGIILMSVNKGQEFEKYLRNLKVPIVTFGNKISDEFPFIWINDEKAIIDAVQYLASKNYEKLIYITPALRESNPSNNMYGPEQRLKGFNKAMKLHKNMESIVITDMNYIDTIDNISNLGNEKVAFLCSSDIYALDILKYAKNKGIHIPTEMGLMGFDNIDTIEYITPSLATVGFSIEDIGIQLVNSLVDKIEGNEIPKRIQISHEIIEGETV